MATRINRANFSGGTPGTGAITVGAAVAGYRTLGSGNNAQSFDGVVITDGTNWEVRNGCVYTHAGTSLARGTLEDSSSGSAVNFAAAVTVFIDLSAQTHTFYDLCMQGLTPGGRLTLESGVPVSTTDQTAKTSIYYTPYVSNVIPLWDGVRWVPISFSEYTLALGTLTSAKPYDVFAYLSSGVLALEVLAWTNDTARATAVTLQDGRYCKSGDKTRLLLGTFYTTSTTTTEDSDTKRFVWNLYNKAARRLLKTMSGSWTYTTNTYRQANADSSYQVEAMFGLASSVNVIASHLGGGNTAGVGLKCSIGEDSTTTGDPSVVGKQTNIPVSVAGDYRQITAVLQKSASAGKHRYVILEASDATGTTTWYGGGTDPSFTDGLTGEVLQ